MKYVRNILAIIALFIFSNIAHAQMTISLKDENATYFLEKGLVEIWEDKDDNLTINEVADPRFRAKFRPIKTSYPRNDITGTTYWLRFIVKNEKPGTQWILECYNIQTSLIELYTQVKKDSFVVDKTGSKFSFNQRTLNHINFDFFIKHLPDNQEKVYYIKFESANEIQETRFLIHTYPSIFNYAINEYYCLGIFYGMILFIAIYNLFLYPRIKDIAYFYYAIYALCVGFFSMTQDGTCFQYLWPNYPEFNLHSHFLFETLLVVFMLLYTKSFLETKVNFPLLNRVMDWFIAIRLLIMIISFFNLPQLSNLMWLDLLAFLMAYFASIISYKKNNKAAIYFILGFSILGFSFLVNTFRIFNIFPANIFTVYFINIGAIIEMILLSQALAERMKKIRENELLQESLNKELEQKVKERTEALMIQKNIIEEKVKELDTFIYKASHDIKGPLKSLIGIAKLGIKDDQANAPLYFNHALKTASKLDAIVSDLLQITKVNNSPIVHSEINFKEIIIDILESFRNLPGYENMKFEIDIDQEVTFYSEKTLMYSVFQNFIENAIKYRNPEAKANKLKILVKSNAQRSEIRFIDNGIGIQEKYFDRLFEMFFRINPTSDDSTGLGLYIVKLAIDKLGGNVTVNSIINDTTTFTVTVPNSSQSKPSIL